MKEPGKKEKYDHKAWNLAHPICDSYLYGLAKLLGCRGRYDREEPIRNVEENSESDLYNVQTDNTLEA